MVAVLLLDYGIIDMCASRPIIPEVLNRESKEANMTSGILVNADSSCKQFAALSYSSFGTNIQFMHVSP